MLFKLFIHILIICAIIRTELIVPVIDSRVAVIAVIDTETEEEKEDKCQEKEDKYSDRTLSQITLTVHFFNEIALKNAPYFHYLKQFYVLPPLKHDTPPPERVVI